MSAVSRHRGKPERPARVGDGCSRRVFVFLRCIACDIGLDERGLNKLMITSIASLEFDALPSSASACHVDYMSRLLAACAPRF